MNNDCSTGLANGQEGSEVTQVTGVLARLCDVRSGFLQHSQETSIVFLCAAILARKSSLLTDHTLLHLQLLPAVKHHFSTSWRNLRNIEFWQRYQRQRRLPPRKLASLGVKWVRLCRKSDLYIFIYVQQWAHFLFSTLSILTLQISPKDRFLHSPVALLHHTQNPDFSRS